MLEGDEELVWPRVIGCSSEDLQCTFFAGKSFIRKRAERGHIGESSNRPNIVKAHGGQQAQTSAAKVLDTRKKKRNGEVQLEVEAPGPK